MSNSIKVTLRTNNSSDEQTKTSQAIAPNNISSLLSQLKKIKEEVNEILTDLINNTEEERTIEPDDFEDDDDDDETEEQISNGPSLQKRSQKNNLKPSKKMKNY